MHIISASMLVLFLNLPFGYWRAHEEKFSRPWFISVHAPVPFVIAVRLLSGLGWHLSTFPFMIGAFFGGQLLGGVLHQRRKKLSKAPVTSCLVWDLVQQYSQSNP